MGLMPLSDDLRALRLVSQRCVWPARAQLGENPRWSRRLQRLYWIDIPKGTVHAYEPATRRRWSARLGAEIGALVQTNTGDLMVGLNDGLWRLSPDLLLGEPVARVAGLPPDCRLNDGACDPAGRLWLASMHRQGKAALGGLYRLDPDGHGAWVDDGYKIANGPAISADGRVLYLADSPLRVIYRLVLDGRGERADKSVFVRFGEDEGYPDGMTLDSTGHLWVAHYDVGRVTRFSSEGQRLQQFTLPVRNVTACAFGGPRLSTLFVTTARQGWRRWDWLRQPRAGGLFALELEPGWAEL